LFSGNVYKLEIIDNINLSIKRQKMKIQANKKALSPIITTILLVLLAIILAIIILLWARGFIAEKISKFDPVQNQERPIQEVCRRADVQGYYVIPSTIYVTNIGSIPIYKFGVRYDSPDGRKQLESRSVNLTAGQSAVITLTEPNALVGAEEVLLIPVLLGNSEKGGIKEYTCLSDTTEIKVGGE
jgi:flagellin-like protein